MFFKVLSHSDCFLIVLFSFNFLLKYNIIGKRAHFVGAQVNGFFPFEPSQTTDPHRFFKRPFISIPGALPPALSVHNLSSPPPSPPSSLLSWIQFACVEVWILWEVDSESEIRAQGIIRANPWDQCCEREEMGGEREQDWAEGEAGLQFSLSGSLGTLCGVLEQPLRGMVQVHSEQASLALCPGSEQAFGGFCSSLRRQFLRRPDSCQLCAGSPPGSRGQSFLPEGAWAYITASSPACPNTVHN